ncbi:MAG: hypothetical protein GY725_04480 [bacterium]|nr:hypothetical protein [bacterium]
MRSWPSWLSLALLLVFASGLPRLCSAQDFDRDGIPDLSDNCSATFNPDQADNGGLLSLSPNGRGDRCECGDGSNDGTVDLIDYVRLAQGLAGAELTAAGFEKCGVNGDFVCNGADVTRLQEIIAQVPVAIEQSCEGSIPPAINITDPLQGAFTTLVSLLVSGVVTNAAASGATVTINGVAAPIQPDLTFSATVPLDPNRIFQPLRALLSIPSTGFTSQDYQTAVLGDSILDGDFSPMGIGLRITDPGFDQLEPVLTTMVPLDANTLIPPGTVLIEDYCALSLFGICTMWVDVVATSTSIGSFGIDIDSMADFVAGDVVVDNLVLNADVVGAGCSVQLSAATTTIISDYDLIPDATDPNTIDVNADGPVSVSLGSFDDSYDCGFFLIDLLVGLIVGNIESQVVQGFEDFLNDPDGSGPLDAPIAEAIEVALAGIQLAGPIGEAIGVNLDTPIYDIFEDVDGITLDNDARVTASLPDPNAPDLLASYHVSESFPVFGPLTPGGFGYDVGLCLSTSAFNQLLKAETERGLLAASITEINLGVPMQITAALLAFLIPEFAQVDPATIMQIRVRPELAPILTGDLGPAGEIAELALDNLIFEVVPLAPPDVLYMSASVSFSSGLEFIFDPNGALVPTLNPPASGDIRIALLDNPLGASEAQVQTTLSTLLPPLLPEVAGVLAAIPLVDFVGLNSSGVEIAREGSFMSVYLELSPGP